MWYSVGKDGKLDAEQFCDFFQLFAPDQKDPELYSENIFRGIDRDQNGVLTFEEFILFLSIMDEKADPEEIIEIVFALYDDDGNGHINKEEIINTLTEIYNMNGDDVKENELKKKIDLQASEILEKCDESKDGYISKDEMLKVLKVDRNLLLGGFEQK